MTNEPESPLTEEVVRSLTDLAYLISNKFPSGVVPVHVVGIARSIEGGAELPDLLRGLVSDLRHVTEGLTAMFRAYDDQEQEALNLRRDVDAMRRVLGIPGA